MSQAEKEATGGEVVENVNVKKRVNPGVVKKNKSKQQPEGKQIDYHLSCCGGNSSTILVVSGYVNQHAANFLIDS